MSDNNAHPGVRSLLAKFESGDSPITSPPSRGRTPVPSDTPGSSATRPLSRVRASFVTVEGAIQSNPGSPLRKTSGRSDSPGIFGPKINQEEVEARRQNVISPTPDGHTDNGQASIMDRTVNEIQQGTEGLNLHGISIVKQQPASRVVSTSSVESAPAKKEEPATSAPAPAPITASVELSEKSNSKTVTKKPSNVHATKATASAKPSPATNSTTGKSTTSPATKPTSARELAKERSNAITHKSSRASLNPASKSTSRTTRGATPSQDGPKTSPTNAPSSKPRSKSPTRPVRLPSSATASTAASSSRLGGTGTSNGRTTTTTASTLTRKPSSLKSAANAPSTRGTTTSSVRRQSSRPSLAAQPAQERPSSRTSDHGSKPVNEGFLARMMRPTASSASKAHEKPDSKTPPKSNPAPVKTTTRRVSDRGTAQVKAKPAALRPQSEKSQPPTKDALASQKAEVKPVEKRDEKESEKENLETVAPKVEEPIVEAQDTIVEQPELETPEDETTKDTQPVELKEPELATEVVPEPSAEPVTELAEPKPAQEEVPEAPAEAPVEAPVQSTDVPNTTADDSVKNQEESTEETPASDVNTTGVENSEPHVEEASQHVTEPPVQPAAEIAADAVKQESSKPEVEVPEVSEPIEAPVQTEEVVLDPSSKSTDETPVKDSKVDIVATSAEEPALPKSDTVDIDFANQLS